METAPSTSKKRRLSGPVPFADSHVSTKNRRISDLVDKNEGDAIIKAAIRIFENRGHKNAAKALEILEENPNNFSNLHGFISEVENKKDKSPMMTPRQGLFHMLGMYLHTCNIHKPNFLHIYVQNQWHSSKRSQLLARSLHGPSTFLKPLTLYPLSKKV